MPEALQILIREWRASHPGETYDTIAERAGLPKSTVYKLATSESQRGIPINRLEALARGLQLPFGVILAAAGVPSPSAAVAAGTRVIRVGKHGDRAQLVFAGDDGGITSIEMDVDVAKVLLVQLATFVRDVR